MPDYVAVGSEFTINSTTGGWQNYPDFAKLTGGRFIAVWESPDDGFSEGVRGRIFGPDGLPIGPDFAINTATNEDQRYPRVAGLADGGFVVTWTTFAHTQEGSQDLVKAQRFDSSGAKVGPEFQVNTVTGLEWQPTVIGLDTGGFVISWETYDGRPTDWGRAIKAQIYDSAGVRVGAEFLVNTITEDAQEHPEIAALPGGRFVIIWSTQVYGKLEVRGQVLDSTGAKIGGEMFINTHTAESQSEIKISTLANGGFVVTWTTFDTTQDGSGYAIKAQLFDPAGAKVGGEFLVNTATASSQKMPTVAGLSNGDFVIVWRTDDQTADDMSGAIKAQVFSSTGVKIGSEFKVNSMAATLETDPVVIDMGNGAFAIGWASSTSPSWDDNIRARIYSSGSAPVIRSDGGGDSATRLIVEHETAVTTVQAADLDSASVTYSLAGGADAALFAIDASTGALSFIAAPSYDSPQDSGGNNVYEVVVRASDGQFSDDQTLSVGVAEFEDVPAIVSNGGGAQAALTVTEGNVQVTTVSAVDLNGDSITYSIAGGADAARFTVDAVTGVLAFAALPDREARADSDRDNVYQVIVRASDGALADFQTLSITVGDVDEAPTITRFNSPVGESMVSSISENNPVYAVFAGADPEGAPVSWSLSGQDAALFLYDVPTGQLRFRNAPDFEAPGSSAGTNSYSVTLGVSDGVLGDSVAITIHIRDVNENPVIVSDGGGASASVTVAENQIAVTTVAAADPERSTLTYSITGGADGARFAIGASTGVLTFVQAPDFEAPQDSGANNVYDVVVTVSDGSKTDTQAIAVTVANVNDSPPPVIAGSETYYFHRENGIAVASFSATAANGGAISWSIAGGADAGRFAIDPVSGALRFVAAPNFEAPQDSGADNFYNVTIAASDGSQSATRALTVEIANLDEGPVIVSYGGGDIGSVTVVENKHHAATIVADDPDARDSAYTFSIVGGADAALFIIHAQTGQLFFRNNVGGNFEAPHDSGGNNVYDVVVSVSDGFSTPDTQALAITVVEADQAPVITSNGGGSAAALTVDENEFAVTTVAATDPEGKALSFAISGGADAQRFTIDAATGALSFVAPPDYELPRDSNQDNVYDVVVSASDGTLSDTQALSIAIGNLNFVDITSDGGNYWAELWIEENQTAVTMVEAMDDDGAGFAYSISGDHADYFTIDAQTGRLSFAVAPDYEVPGGWRDQNVYYITVTVSAGTASDSQDLAIYVNDILELDITYEGYDWRIGEILAPENGTTVATLVVTGAEGPFTYEIVGGTEAQWFVIDPETGVLSFRWEQDFEGGKYAHEDPESWGDEDYLHLYEVTVRASNGVSAVEKALLVRLQNVDEAPEFYYHDGAEHVAMSVLEGTRITIFATAYDPEPYSPITYSLEGADAGLFQITPYLGHLSWWPSFDHGAPTDADGDNVYEVTVVARSGGLSASQSFSITTGNRFDPVWISSNGGGASATLTVAENSSAVTVFTAGGDGPVHYEIVGGADADWFTLDANSGELTFAYLPNYEDHRTKSHGGHAPSYYVTVRAYNDGSYDDQSLTIQVQDVDEAPSFVSYGGAADVALTVNENVQAVAIARAYDPDSPATVTYALAGGADAALFEVDPTSGALRLKQGADFEAPADSDGDNVYEVTVSANPGAASATQAFSITIADVDENVAITSNGGGDSASVSVVENGKAVTTVAAASGLSVTYSIVGGADRSLFSINASTGALSFISTPDFEKIADFDRDNVFDVIVRAANGVASDDQHLSVNLTNVDEVPYFFDRKPSVGLQVTENGDLVRNVAATDADGGPAIAYALAGGSDAQFFVVDPHTGILSFRAGWKPDFEAPSDSDGDNVYIFQITASQGSWSSTKVFTVEVENANEQPRITSNGGGASAAIGLDEGQTAVTIVTSVDDGPNPVAYSITGGTHAGLFAIDSATGALSFVAAPDHEAPLGGSNNLYSVTVTASDGQLSSSQSLQVAIRDINEGVTITSGAAVSVVENGFWVTGVAAHDLDGDPVSFALSGGADSSLFAIDSQSGELRFLAAPNFEAPADSDGDNVYEVEVSASDGTLSGSKTISVTVTNQDEDVVIVSGGGGSEAAVTVNENDPEVMTLLAVDPDGGSTPRLSIMAGADGDRFYIDPETQTLRFHSMPVFNVRPDFETPRDSDGDNVYEVVIGTTDGDSYDSQTIWVTVANVFEGLGWVWGRSFSVQEGTEEIGSVSGPEEGLPIVYSIIGGPDASLFSIDPVTGAIRWIDSPDFEAPRDSDGDNFYEIEVAASDGINSYSQFAYVAVDNAEEAVVFTSDGGGDGAQIRVAENGTAVTVVAASDPDGGPVTYAITGGADAARFTIDPSSGALAFAAAPDFETTRSAGGNNEFDVVVTASDGSSTDSQTLSVILEDVVEGVVIASYGGSASVSTTLVEGQFTTYDVDAWEDTEVFAPIAYALSGADAAFFTIDNQGRFSFDYDALPDFEGPADADGDNVYEVTVTASISTFSDSQAFAITIVNRDENVVFTSGGGEPFASFTMGENGTVAATVSAIDPEGGAVSYAISGGFDAALFTIDSSTGALAFITAPDFEHPADQGGDGVYNVSVTATDGTFTASQFIDVTVENVDEPVEILSYGGASTVSLTMTEGAGLTVATVEADDEEDWTVTYSITGGADAALFRIDASTGILAFNHGVYPDFETPADAGGDNVYDVVVTASSSTSSAAQAFAIAVADRNEGLWITSDGGGDASLTMNEGDRSVTIVTAEDQDGDVPAYSIVGGADSALFAIDPATGALTFIAAPDYETPSSAAGTNVYLVEVGASDGEFLGTQRIRIQIGNVNEAPVITFGGGGTTASVTVDENALAAANVTASDVDGNILTYSIAGGADSSRFTIDAQTGALRFVQAPNFEAPADAGANNVYDVVVSVSDGLLTDSQAVAVTVANLAEIVAITSNGGGSGASVAVAENGIAVTTVTAGSSDGGGAVTYAIAGGADAARFTIDPATGALAFLAAPNFEAPADSGANNVYDVVVSASNGATTDTQALAVTVGNVNEPLAITSNGGGAGAAVSVSENGTAVTIVAASDPEGGPLTYAIVGGADSARFTINAATGALAFRAAPDFEAPGDSGGNNVYDVVVWASDGSYTDTQSIAVTVGNVNEAPVITSNGGNATGNVSVAENNLLVAIVAATDPEGSTAVYSIVGGADAARFTINAQTGILQFIAPPDWEMPGNSTQNNVYAVVVRASDGTLVDDQALSVTVTNARDGNNVTGTSGGDMISATSTNLSLRTSNEEDLVFGRDGHDSIYGMGGDDELYGEGGNDLLAGGEGSDKLLGGLGKDQFTYAAVSDSTAVLRDLIMDFSRTQGDKISLSAIDSNSALSGNQAFTFIGTAAFSNTAGQLRYETAGGMTTVFGDVNGDGVADLQIQLSGSIALSASDFIL